MEQQKKNKPFYLLLLLIFYLLHHYNELFGFISLTQISFYIVISLLTFLCYFLFNLFYKSPQKAGLITFFLLSFFLFFGTYHDFLKTIFKKSFISSYKVVVPLSFLSIFLFTFYLHKRPASMAKFSRYLNILMVIICSVEIFAFFVNVKQFMKDHNLIYPEMPMCNNYRALNLPDSSKPDIYYLIFDEYTNSKTLQDIWQFNNSDITNWLSNKGFYNVSNSKSNYNATPFSVSSAFNMNYIDQEKGDKGSSVNDLKANQSLSINETFCILKKENYTIRFIAPFNNSIEENELIHYFNYLSEEQLYSSTFLERFKKDILWNFKKKDSGESVKFPDSYSRKAEDLALTIAKIKATTDSSINRKPKFVYGHFMITHDPHLFDSTGNIRTNKDFITNTKPFETYTQQILYANRVIKELVNHIQLTNKKKTVIIIQGDHGYRDLPISMQTYYFPIFNAVYFPDKNYNQFYNEMSPVNTFRILFNHYFYQKYEILKDSSIVVKQL